MPEPNRDAGPVCLLVNPSAGGGRARRAAPKVQGRLRELGLQVRRADTRNMDDARALALAAARSGETVACLSGDGMVGAVADELRELPGALLGLLPGGRGNDLARVLGIAADPVQACDTIAHGLARPLDLGLVMSGGPVPGGPVPGEAAPGRSVPGEAAPGKAAPGESVPGESEAGSGGRGRAFVGIASVGFDSEANRIANAAPARLGNLVYAYGALRALIGWRPAGFEIELEPGGHHAFTGYTVGAANSKSYGGGMKAAPGALLDDGLLDVLVLEQASKVRFLTRILPAVFSGRHVDDPNVRVFRAREVSVRADRPFTMYADGDPIGELPVRVRALHGAVRVLVPPRPPRDAFLAPGSADP